MVRRGALPVTRTTTPNTARPSPMRPPKSRSQLRKSTRYLYLVPAAGTTVLSDMARGWEDRWMTGDTIARSRRLNGWRIARIGLVAVWVLWAALAWWTQPRYADVQQACDDLLRRRVATVAFSTEVVGHSFPGPAVLLRNTASTESPYLVWRTGDWRVHYTELRTPQDKPDLERLVDG